MAAQIIGCALAEYRRNPIRVFLRAGLRLGMIFASACCGPRSEAPRRRFSSFPPYNLHSPWHTLRHARLPHLHITHIYGVIELFHQALRIIESPFFIRYRRQTARIQGITTRREHGRSVRESVPWHNGTNPPHLPNGGPDGPKRPLSPCQPDLRLPPPYAAILYAHLPSRPACALDAELSMHGKDRAVAVLFKSFDQLVFNRSSAPQRIHRSRYDEQATR